MIVSCTSCQTKFRVPDDKIPPEGTHVRCSKCQTTFFFAPKAEGSSVKFSVPDRPQYAPSTDASKDSWFDLPKQEAEGFGRSEPQPTQKHDLQFRDSWWGTNSLDMLLQEQGLSMEALTSASSSEPETQQDENYSPFQPQSPQPPESSPLMPFGVKDKPPDPILGNVMEELSTTSHFDPSYPELVSKRPQDIKLEIPSDPRPEPVAPRQQVLIPEVKPPKIDEAALASVRQPAEFLLLDQAQQRKDFWFTFIPLAVRGAILFALVGFFVVLWTLLDQKSGSAEGLSMGAIKRTFIGAPSPWRIDGVHIQQMPRQRKYLLVVSGTLSNKSSQALPYPDLQLEGVLAASKKLKARWPCCRTFKRSQLASLDSTWQIRSRYLGLYRSRKKLQPGKQKRFTILVLPSSPLQSIELQVREPSKRPPKLRKPPRPRPPLRKKDAPLKKAGKKKARKKKARKKNKARKRRRRRRRRKNRRKRPRKRSK